MFLSWVELTDVRCYPSLEFRPEPGINVLVGRNGAGKTTVLESIGYLSMLRSFRKTPDSSLVATNSSGAVIRGGFEKRAGETRIEVEIPAVGRRRVLLNGKRPSRLSAVATEVPVVAFLPDDLDLIKDSDGIRRRYLDELGSQLSPQYGAALSEYEKTLRQRNALLRNDGPDTDPMTLGVLDHRLVSVAEALWHHRCVLAESLQPVLEDAYTSVAGPEARLSIRHLCATASPSDGGLLPFDPDTSGAALAAGLVARRRREMEQRTTTLGPHRDPIVLSLGERDTRSRASQGEQRSVAISLRVAAFQLIEMRVGSPPVLLLDDVFSELDLDRTRALVSTLPDGQILVTTTREDEVPIEGARWTVHDGKVER